MAIATISVTPGQDLDNYIDDLTQKPTAMLVTKHAEDTRGTRGNGQKAVNKLE